MSNTDPHGGCDDEPHGHDLGLQADLTTLVNRRRALLLLGGGAAALALIGCSSSSKTSTASAASTSSSSASSSSATTTTTPTTLATATTVAPSSPIPEETAGPYPGDGSNGPEVLTQSGVVRSDITSSFGTSSTVATGVPMTVELTVVDAATGKAMPGAAVYIWHCDQAGRYSMYSQGVTNENYLRGVQAAGVDGKVTFQSIYPACYSGRWPHVHFEVYPSLDAVTSASNKIATSQLALPDATNTAVYATSGYESSVRTYSGVSLKSDMVFSDGADAETPAVTGDPTSGYTFTLTVPVSS